MADRCRTVMQCIRARPYMFRCSGRIAVTPKCRLSDQESDHEGRLVGIVAGMGIEAGGGSGVRGEIVLVTMLIIAALMTQKISTYNQVRSISRMRVV